MGRKKKKNRGDGLSLLSQQLSSSIAQNTTNDDERKTNIEVEKLDEYNIEGRDINIHNDNKKSVSTSKKKRHRRKMQKKKWRERQKHLKAKEKEEELSRRGHTRDTREEVAQQKEDEVMNSSEDSTIDGDDDDDNLSVCSSSYYSSQEESEPLIDSEDKNNGNNTFLSNDDVNGNDCYIECFNQQSLSSTNQSSSIDIEEETNLLKQFLNNNEEIDNLFLLQLLRKSWLNNVFWIGKEQGITNFVNNRMIRENDSEKRTDAFYFLPASSRKNNKKKRKSFSHDIDESKKTSSKQKKKKKIKHVFHGSKPAQLPPLLTQQQQQNQYHTDTSFSYIRNIQCQQVYLNQIKSQLHQACVEYAKKRNTTSQQQSKSHNKNKKNDKKKQEMTPNRAFQIAREACNPFEFLTAYSTSSLSNNNSKRKRRNQQNKQETRHHHVQQNDNDDYDDGEEVVVENQFLNRSAIKLVNMNAILGFQLLENENSSSSTTLRFVDLCGAPGGFSEYIMYHHLSKKFFSKSNDHINHHITKKIQGWGMSLQGSNDQGEGIVWNLYKSKVYNDCLMLSELQNMQEKEKDNQLKKKKGQIAKNAIPEIGFHVCSGVDGTGDIFIWDNTLELQNDILQKVSCVDTPHSYINTDDNSNNGMIDIVVSDGGCQAQRNDMYQEYTTFPLILSEILSALYVLRKGGNFICKLFGTTYKTTQKVLFLLIYQKFEKFCIIKPITSRPASAERYLICIGFLGFHQNMDGDENSNVGCESIEEEKVRDEVGMLRDWKNVNEWKEKIIQEMNHEHDLIVSSSSSIATPVDQYIDDEDYGINTNSSSFPSSSSLCKAKASFQQYLYKSDMDMLQLNIKACSAILSFLKSNQRHKGKTKNINVINNWSNVLRKVYKKAWRIDKPIMSLYDDDD